MPTAKVCTICNTEPALGAGVGKMKSTCGGCVQSLVAEGTCPACRGVEMFSTAHVMACDGKLPKVAKGSHTTKAPKGGTGSGSNKTAHQIGVEGEANKRSEARRSVATPTREEASELLEAAEAALKKLIDAGGATEKQVVNAKKKVADAKAVVKAASQVPEGRCPTCNCFLSDRGKCVNDECADAA